MSTNSKTETSYAARQRRRAEKIIAASGCYNAEFRAEVQTALDSAPFKLPLLFREADAMDKRLALAGAQLRSRILAAGVPIGSMRPLRRSPKKHGLRLAEEIETLFLADAEDRLDDDWAGRANLVSDILFEAGNETGVHATHPALVKGYFMAMLDTLGSLVGRDYEMVQKSFAHVRELMGGCSEQRAEEIAAYYSLDNAVSMPARAREFGKVHVPRNADPEWADHVCRFCRASLGLVHSASCPFVGGGVMSHQCGPDVEVLSERPEAAALPNPALDDWCVGCRCDTCRQEGCNDYPTHKGVCWQVPQESPELVNLRGQITALERLPENEATRLWLETEIARLEREAAVGEWPDVIGETN